MKLTNLVLVLTVYSILIFPQDPDINFPVLQDSILTTQSDTSSANLNPKKKSYDVDTVIYTKANDSLIFFVKDRKMNIYGEGSLNYRETDLKAANIFVDFETSNIEASGVRSDTLAGSYLGTPVLKDKGEVYEGFRMKYNFKTRRGIISSAQTESEGTYYTGSKIKKVDNETYFVQDGVYTTCSEPNPHY